MDLQLISRTKAPKGSWRRLMWKTKDDLLGQSQEHIAAILPPVIQQEGELLEKGSAHLCHVSRSWCESSSGTVTALSPLPQPLGAALTQLLAENVRNCCETSASRQTLSSHLPPQAFQSSNYGWLGHTHAFSFLKCNYSCRETEGDLWREHPKNQYISPGERPWFWAAAELH